MSRKASGIWFIVTGLLVGLVGNVFFYGRVIGLSFPLFMVVSAAALLISSRALHRQLTLRNLWPLVPLFFFAAMVAVRADGQIVMLNLLAVLALGALTIHYLPSRRFIDTSPLADHARGVIEAGFYLIPGALFEAGQSWGWLREKRLHDRGPFLAIGRGLLLAIPLVIVFALLLASADLVFADLIDQLWKSVSFQNVEDLMGQGATIGTLAWMTTGALAYGLGLSLWRAGSVQPAADSDGETPSEAVIDEAAANPPKRAAIPFRLGIIEAGIILGSVNLLFIAFVLIQMAYLFGGSANVAVGQFTYAEYARRGFFELVAVSALTLGLILTLDHITVREGKRQTMIFRGLAVLIVVLSALLLVSASRRMLLYEEAYGFTHLRVYTHIFMFWLGVLQAVFVLALFRLRENIFSLGVILVMVGYLGTLNLMDVDLYIAERNIARYHEDGRSLDIQFLQLLSVDAVPPMLALYQEAAANPDATSSAEIVQGIGQWLAFQLMTLDNTRDGTGLTLFSANLSRDRAWSMLDAVRGDLPAYDLTLSRRGNFD